ncbi:MAG TPA: hypothetical protein EYM80_11800, partial [Deltaproteobacteria bacterium]|nr:hypothetical protein [Deltaproteobacteria bacterium]
MHVQDHYKISKSVLGPPHKHDSDNLPEESSLEEIYYF